MEVPNRKKVLYVVTQGVLGGAQKYVLDLAAGLKDHFDCAIASGEGEGLRQAAEAAGIPYYPLSRLTRDIRPARDISAIFEIARLVRALEPDIVHLNSSKAMVIGVLGAKFGGAKIIIATTHGLVLSEPMAAFKRSAYGLAIKIAAKFENAMITMTEADKKAVKEYKLIPQKKIYLVHNGIDLKKLNFLTKDEARAKLAAGLGVNFKDKKIIFSLADHYPVKGLDILAEAVAMIKDRDDFVVIIVGRKGPGTELLERTKKRLGLENNFFIKPFDNPTELLKAAEIYVLPSLKEGLPYAPLFSSSAHLPLVGSMIGATEEIFEKGKNEKSALLIPPGEPKALAEAIERVLDDPSLGQKLGAAAAESVKDYTLEKMLAETKKVYDEFLK